MRWPIISLLLLAGCSENPVEVLRGSKTYIMRSGELSSPEARVRVFVDEPTLKSFRDGSPYFIGTDCRGHPVATGFWLGQEEALPRRTSVTFALTDWHPDVHRAAADLALTRCGYVELRRSFPRQNSRSREFALTS